MVMHARKLPRLNDGYFERAQGHSYDSTSKYVKANNDRVSDKVRGSPVASNSDMGRNDTVDNRNSPRYHRSCSQRIKDRDHHEDNSSKSPIIRGENKGAIGSTVNSKECHKVPSTEVTEGLSAVYQSNHEKNSVEENDRRLQVGDWSEHISSSGKKYYYNCKTEISQWEKPKELVEWERQQNICKTSYDLSRTKDRGYERQTASAGSKNSQAQEMDISPDRCEPYNCHTDSETPSRTQAPASASAYLPLQQSLLPQSTQVQTHLLSPSQVTLSNLPKLISQLAGTKGLPNLSELSPQEALRTIQQALQLTKQVTNLSQTDSQIQKSSSPVVSQIQAVSTNHHAANAIQSANISQNTNVCQLNANNAMLANYPIQQHSSSDGKLDSDNCRLSPGSDCSTRSSRHDSPTSSVSSLHSLNATGTSSLASAVLKPSIPSLTPSLGNYYCENLISHVLGWQADHAERQANRYWEDGHNLGSLNCTQVSAELKMARALVRFAEIQATLQQQRILFLRQQTKKLEEWRSQNSYMSDS